MGHVISFISLVISFISSPASGMHVQEMALLRPRGSGPATAAWLIGQSDCGG
jgi:hypothetical protein